ncbi:uncharacterized protein M421DRAFT_6130 [Didymella exigua CBS 183.55]|uniref:Uncharacterized protein n=1 Tax=Didymella exigua CBS 183.55 TaxID=1150837 RepID=A0A6A5RHS5_9PLEO|nr:uncharacterized protein M421DRAFT_6130 [Didymella exigua CBS 183.55]KAF1927342.1 hypothetical protein M421DRAFT_6130 [Didymella exigua CBS 183.55]
MEHEAMRSDRDAHILYQCKNIFRYYAAYQRAVTLHPEKSPAELETALCEDAEFAHVPHTML